MTSPRIAATARAFGAAMFAGGAGYALRIGGAPWPVLVPSAAGAALLTLWRTIPGAWAGFAALALGAAVAWHGASLPAQMRDLAQPLMVLELFGWVSIIAVMLVRDPRRVSRRLLTSWLGSGGALLLGMGLCASMPDRGIGSALIAAGLVYRLGCVPAYAWAPLLMRHPATRITVLGVAATLLAVTVLLFALPLLPQTQPATTTIIVLCAVTMPWAAWHVVRQWQRDRRCAFSYLMVFVVSAVLVAVLKLLSA